MEILWVNNEYSQLQITYQVVDNWIRKLIYRNPITGISRYVIFERDKYKRIRVYRELIFENGHVVDINNLINNRYEELMLSIEFFTVPTLHRVKYGKGKQLDYYEDGNGNLYKREWQVPFVYRKNADVLESIMDAYLYHVRTVNSMSEEVRSYDGVEMSRAEAASIP